MKKNIIWISTILIITLASAIMIHPFRANPNLEKLSVTIDNGVKIAYKNYSTTIIPYFVMNSSAVFEWGDIPDTIDKDLWKDQVNSRKYKYGVDFNNVSQNVRDNLKYVVLHRSASENLTINDTKLSGNSLIIKNKIIISHNDLLINYTIVKINKTDLIIGNITENFVLNENGTYDIIFDPTITLDERESITLALLTNMTAQTNFTHLPIVTLNSSLERGFNLTRRLDLLPYAGDDDNSHMEFDGDNGGDYILIDDNGDSFGKNVCIDGCSFSAWSTRKEMTSTVTGILGRADATSNDRFFILYTQSDGDTVFGIYENGNATACDIRYTGGDISANIWYHYLGVYDNSTGTGNISLYRDGVFLQNEVCPFSGINLTAWQDDEDVLIGSYDDSGAQWEMNGSIDAVHIWNRSLSGAEVSALYDTGRDNSTVDDENLISKYLFDDPTIALAEDTKGFNNGTLTGDVAYNYDYFNYLVAYYPFDGDVKDTALTTHYDYTTNGNDGTGNGDVAVNESDCLSGYGNCAYFDGNGDYIEIAHNNNQRLNEGGTISSWIYPITFGGNDNGRIVDKNSDNDGYGFYMHSNQRVDFRIDSSGGGRIISSAEGSITLNNWHHVAVSFEESGYTTIYVNGVQSGTPAHSLNTSEITTNSTIRIGDLYVPVRGFNGSIDEVMIFNTNLSAQQILDIYNNQSSRFTSEGTQKVKAEKITDTTTWTTGYDIVNITADYFENMGNISARIGQINISVDPDGLVAYYPFEWGVAADISGNENDGILNGDTFINESGRNDTFGAHFDGVNGGDYIIVDNNGDSFGKDVCIDGCTFSAWGKKVSLNEHGVLVGRYDEGGDNAFFYLEADNDQDTRAKISRNGNISFCEVIYTGGDISANIWYHYVGVYDNSTGTGNVSVYRDGVFLKNTECDFAGINITAWQDDEDFFIGTFDDGNIFYEWNGTIDDVMIFNRSLSASEIEILYFNQTRKFNDIYYTDYLNLTTATFTNFTISNGADFIFPDFLITAGNITDPFLSPVLKNMTLDYSVESEGVAAASYEANISQGISSTTGIDKGLGLHKSIFQTLSPSNLIRLVLELSRKITQAISSNQLVNTIGSFFKSIFQSFTSNNLASRTSSVFKSILQSLNLDTLTSRTANFFKSIFQSFTSNNLVTAVKSRARNILQSLSINNMVDNTSSLFRTILQSLNLDTLTSRTANFFKSIFQSFTSNNLVSTVISQARNIFQSFNLEELAGRVGRVSRNIFQRLFAFLIIPEEAEEEAPGAGGPATVIEPEKIPITERLEEAFNKLKQTFISIGGYIFPSKPITGFFIIFISGTFIILIYIRYKDHIVKKIERSGERRKRKINPVTNM